MLYTIEWSILSKETFNANESGNKDMKLYV
jgi:hypothetical protein